MELQKFRLPGSKDKRKRKTKEKGEIHLLGRHVWGGTSKITEEKERVKVVDPKTGAVYYEYRPKTIELKLSELK